MFLYLLNEREGKAFMELANQVVMIGNNGNFSENVEFKTYLIELNLENYKISGLSYEDAVAAFKFSTIPVKRSVIMELCGIIYTGVESYSEREKWIYKLSERLQINKQETERLMRWSKDFSEFLEIGIMYINAKS